MSKLTQSIEQRKLAFERVVLNKSIGELAEAHGITYSAMWQRLKKPEMRWAQEQMAEEMTSRQQDMITFMRLNGPEYVLKMHTLAMSSGKDQRPALEWFLDRLLPQEDKAQQHEVNLTGEVAEKFASAMEAFRGKLADLPPPGAIHDDPHLLEGKAALPQLQTLDEES